MPRSAAVLAGEGPCARKTTCKRGHPFDDANTYIDPVGRRRCRSCKLTLERAWHARTDRRVRTALRRCEMVEAA